MPVASGGFFRFCVADWGLLKMPGAVAVLLKPIFALSLLAAPPVLFCITSLCLSPPFAFVILTGVKRWFCELLTFCEVFKFILFKGFCCGLKLPNVSPGAISVSLYLSFFDCERLFGTYWPRCRGSIPWPIRLPAGCGASLVFLFLVPCIPCLF